MLGSLRKLAFLQQIVSNNIKGVAHKISGRITSIRTSSNCEMPLQVNEVVDVYREFSKFPTISSGRICTAETPGHLRVYSHWSQRDLERAENVKFSRTHIVQLDVVIPTPPHEIGTEQLRKESPSGKYSAIVRKIKDKKGEEQQYIEVWSDSKKLHNIDVQALDQHGKIHEDVTFGTLEWSHSETHLLYMAEKKRPKSKSFYDKKASEEAEQGKLDAAQGDEHLYVEHWGEQLVGKSHPVPCVLDIEGGMVSILENIPEEYSAGPAIWCPDDSGVICVGTCHEPYRLGIIYCPIRRSMLFHIDLKTFKCTILGADNRAVRTPRFSQDNSKFIFLDNEAGGPHMQCSRLVMCDWATKGIVPVIDIVRTADENGFPGIFTQGLTSRCFTNDNKRVVMTSQWGNHSSLIVINIETGKVSKISNDEGVGGWHLLDVHNDLVLAVCSSPNQPQYLVLGQMPSQGNEASIKWTKLDDPETLEGIKWKSLKFTVPENRINKEYKAVTSFDGYLMEPQAHEADKQSPLLVMVHVNYRGSFGFGQDSIESLPGNVGTQDVQDVQEAVEEVLASGVGDRDRVVVIGGSHGGFITTHLVGQYPDFYKAACARNPAINIASMVDTTDIRDWCYVESGLKFDHKAKPSPEMYAEMWKCSPIRYVDEIKTPMLIMLGANDLRVPPGQGHELRKALQARGVPVRMLCYADNSHPIIKVDSEADAFVNIIKWFNEHIGAM